MSLSPKQTARYWREWGEVCRVQGWAGREREERRRVVHKQARCPHSMREFDNRAFDRYLRECAALRNQVDIRDRERERVEVAVERLNAAIREITGKDYALGIVRDMNDREQPLDLPLDPIPEQVERGDATFNPRKYGKRKFRAGFDHAHADLANLRDTLKNRLSSLLTQIKAGKLDCPKPLAWILEQSAANNPAIDAIIAGKVAIRRSNGRAVWYEQVSPAEHEKCKPAAAPVAKPAPQTPQPDPYASIYAAVGYDPTDDNVPF